MDLDLFQVDLDGDHSIPVQLSVKLLRAKPGRRWPVYEPGTQQATPLATLLG